MFNDRPLSPHLQVYKPQITSSLSILHRITGILLFIGLILFSWIFISATMFADFYDMLMSHINRTIIILLSFLFVMSFFYHFFNGIRHLIWDAGYGFSKSSVVITGVSVLLLSIFFSFVFLVMIII